MLYLTWQNLISSNSFSQSITAVTFEQLNVWFPIWFNRTVQGIYRIDITVSLFYPCFLVANFAIYCLNFTERIDSFILVYRMSWSKSDILNLYRKDHLAILLFIKFTLSSKFDCLIIISFPKIQFLTQQQGFFLKNVNSKVSVSFGDKQTSFQTSNYKNHKNIENFKKS